MNGYGLRDDDQDKLRKFLRVIQVQSLKTNFSTRIPIAKIDKENMLELFHNEESHDHKDFLNRKLEKTKMNLKS